MGGDTRTVKQPDKQVQVQWLFSECAVTLLMLLTYDLVNIFPVKNKNIHTSEYIKI